MTWRMRAHATMRSGPNKQTVAVRVADLDDLAQVRGAREPGVGLTGSELELGVDLIRGEVARIEGGVAVGCCERLAVVVLVSVQARVATGKERNE